MPCDSGKTKRRAIFDSNYQREKEGFHPEEDNNNNKKMKFSQSKSPMENLKGFDPHPTALEDESDSDDSSSDDDDDDTRLLKIKIGMSKRLSLRLRNLDPHDYDSSDISDSSDESSEIESDSDNSRLLKRKRIDLCVIGRPGQMKVRPFADDKDELYLMFCRCSKIAIAKYNKDNDTTYRFFRYVTATYTVGGGFEYNVTFQATTPSDNDNPTTFNAKILQNFGKKSQPQLVSYSLVATKKP